ncbi:FCS-Like Zinc finger 11 [Phragmites australis]|uniref:FCS-Like Zinc finger 11 n=1 Tax=Phragmites australis TaxID=29695 RepID=UPI002D779C6E|nr:FCS-Like Zinc finger 11 [Phragmites australis]XP_062203846.1 FCS-Like Zinc finger 11 [Phragmites australis]
MTAESSSVSQTSSESIAQKMGFFRVPDVLVKLSTKCLIELDAVRSPTSPLDLKFFTGLGAKSPRSFSLDASQNQKILLGDRVGLGLVDSLSDENPTPMGSRKVLLGSEMRITDNLPRKNSSTAPVQAEEVVQKDDNMSDGMKGSIMSLDDIVNSEDYTCVVSRGPNPRTTHIFGDRVFEFQVEQLMPNESKGAESMSPHVKEGTMSFCCFCSEKLKEGKDIYIYQGDKAFCSMECRENFMEDEMEQGEPMTDHHVSPSSSPFEDGRIFQLIR